MDCQPIVETLYKKYRNIPDHGKAASYIPELKKVDPNKFGIHLSTISGENYSAGDSFERFSIQSISKVFGLTLVLKLIGDELWKRVGVEPSGDPFNSLVQLETEKGIPRNPMINSGALVVCDILTSKLNDPVNDFLNFIRNLAQNNTVDYNEKVVASEKAWGFVNTAHVNLMKAYGNIQNDIDRVLDLYYHMCSLEMNCGELSQTFLVYANGGVIPGSEEKIISTRLTKRINSIMQLCGLYDEAGEFAFRVGLPGKSGVGGGIVAVRPGSYAISVWSPRLNPKGNSIKAMGVLEDFTTMTESSIF